MPHSSEKPALPADGRDHDKFAIMLNALDDPESGEQVGLAGALAETSGDILPTPASAVANQDQHNISKPSFRTGSAAMAEWQQKQEDLAEKRAELSQLKKAA